MSLIKQYVMMNFYIYLLSYYDVFFIFFKQKTAYEMRISDWSSDVCSSDLRKDISREHQHRCDRIDEEVEELRRPPDDDADRDLARGALRLPGVDRTAVAFERRRIGSGCAHAIPSTSSRSRGR